MKRLVHSVALVAALSLALAPGVRADDGKPGPPPDQDEAGSEDEPKKGEDDDEDNDPPDYDRIDDVDPDKPETDVDPEPPDWDVDPDTPGYDVDPDPEHGAEEGAEGTAGEAGEGGEAKKPKLELPKDGLAERPQMPHVDRDLIQADQGVVGRAQAQISWEKKGEDHYLFLNLGTIFAYEKWRFAPRLPIRFRLIDEEPESDSLVREQDWNEPSDFLRIIAYVQYGNIGDPLYLRFGELTGVTLGHGSMLNRYYNTIDIDHYQGGVYLYGDIGIVGGEAILDNVFDPDIMGARVFARPLDWLKKLPFALQKLKVGMTIGADVDAPLRVARGVEGELLVDEENNARIIESSAMPFFGFDLEVPIVSSPHVDVVPYTDVSSIDSEGVGWHLGTYLNFRFTPLASLNTRLEYFYEGPGYEAMYISPFYEIQRVQWNLGGDYPKLRWLREDPDVGDKHGFYLESELRISGVMRYAIVFSNKSGEDNANLLMRLQFPYLGPLKLSFYYGRLGFGGLDDMFEFTRTLFGISGRLAVFNLFFVRFSVMNEWWLPPQSAEKRGYETTLDYNFGFGLLLKF